jgi:uncharacterized protein (DUF779 family)
MVERVVFTSSAAALVRELKARSGPLVFHQSGGCCEGSAPMCFAQADFRVGSHDVLLGTIEECPFYIGGAQHERWGDSMQFVIDVVPSSSGSFSLEAADDVRFISGARMFTAAELADLRADVAATASDAC